MNDQTNKPIPDVEAYIDDNLRRVYARLEQENVPERFQKLLAQLEAQDAKDQAE